jgi:hypothetical protein
MRPDDRIRLTHMLEACRAVSRFVAGRQRRDLDEDEMLRFALVRGEKRKAGGSLIKAAPGTLKPWREIVTPHADVASGRYQQAEFAADL